VSRAAPLDRRGNRELVSGQGAFKIKIMSIRSYNTENQVFALIYQQPFGYRFLLSFF